MKLITLLLLLITTNYSQALQNTSVTLQARELLYKKQYKKLNKFLNDLQKKAKENIAYETKSYAAFKAFEFSDNSFEQEIDLWVKQTPNNYQPYLARAFYYFDEAWEARGKKWASETKENQFKQMKLYFDKATLDLEKTLELIDNSTIPYYLQLRISNTLGDHQEYEILKKGLKVDDRSYQLRKMYLLSITPRWGGSFTKMQKYIKQIRPLFKKYPHLNGLQGIPFREAGRIQYSNHVYSDAIREFTKALSFGDDHYSYFKRSRAYYKNDEYQKAISDMNKAIELYPEDADYYYYRAFIYYQLDDIKNDTTNTLMALKFAPENYYYIEHRDTIVSLLEEEADGYITSGKNTEALEIYNKVIKINPQYARNYSLRAHALIKLARYEEAKQDLLKAISIEPQTYYYYNLLDWLLTKKKNWQQIIFYWEKYIKLNPLDARALVQQSGAYYHLGQIKKALEFAKKAADMGDAQGQEIYDKYKHLL